MVWMHFRCILMFNNILFMSVGYRILRSISAELIIFYCNVLKGTIELVLP